MLRLIKKKKDPTTLDISQAIVLPIDSANRSLDYLIEMIKKIRPSSPDAIGEAEMKFKALLFQLSEDTSSVLILKKALLSQLIHSNVVEALTESGVITSRGFIQEFLSRLKHKLLPSIQNPDDFLYVINRVFYKRWDYEWVTAIDGELWEKLFELLGVKISINEPQLRWQLQQALQILSYRIASLGLEKEMLHLYTYMEDAVQPFIDQNHWVQEYLSGSSSHSQAIILSNIEEAIHNCRQSIQWIKDQRKDYGTSLAQTYLVTRLQQQIERIFIVIGILDVKNESNTTHLLEYFTGVIKFENTRNSVRSLVSDVLGLLAYQIAGHRGKQMERYISESRTEYIHIFKSALGGGFFIAFMAIFKRLLGFIKIAPFWQGFIFSANYTCGFAMMDNTDAGMATRQPAYTSSLLASSMDGRTEDKPDLNNLAATIAKVIRSQVASFTGNLLMVFPVTYGLAWLFERTTGSKLAEGGAALKLLEDQHPWHSPALIYAAFTGIFIFLSGLIAGYVENHVVYGTIGARLQQHPVFQQTLSKKRLNRIVRLVTKNSGMIAGSIALGLFFGFAPTFGGLLGIPFNIRHITLSAADATIGFFGINTPLATGYIITILSGILLIGFINFFVSFNLAFYLAVKSRGLALKDYPKFMKVLVRYFLKHPQSFIFK